MKLVLIALGLLAITGAVYAVPVSSAEIGTPNFEAGFRLAKNARF
jgi:hypothetical protein